MKQPILITGIHRSGSTWIGKTINASSEIKYIHEPFNLIIDWANPYRKFGYYTRKSPLTYWFEYFDIKTSKNKRSEILKFVKNFYEFNTTVIFHEIGKIRNFKDIEVCLNELKSRNKRPLLKNPLALLSSEFLEKELNCKVIISIRHPAAFIASIKKKTWGFDFNNLLSQERLMSLHLSKYEKEIVEYCENQYPIIDQGILLWNILYSFVSELEERHAKDWYFVKHETISRDPISEFGKIFKFLDLEFTSQIIKQINKSTSGNIKDDLNRNSLENIKSWKNILTTDEIQKIKTKTKTVSSKFYTDADWN